MQNPLFLQKASPFTLWRQHCQLFKIKGFFTFRLKYLDTFKASNNFLVVLSNDKSIKAFLF